MKKILSLVMIVAMIFTFAITSYAADAAMTITADEDANGVVTFTVKGTGNGFYSVKVRLKTEGLTYIENSFVLISTYSSLDNENTIKDFYAEADTIKLEFDDYTANHTLTDSTIMTFKCQAASVGNWNAAFIGTSGSKRSEIGLGDDTFTSKDGDVVLVLNPHEGGGEEEFEATYEGVKAEDGTVSEGFAAGSKVATVFAKAETALTAGTYGIVFGGQKYVGAGDVAEGKYWVIRLYDPSGEILTGTYDCQKFVGEAVEAADYKLETK